MLVAVTATNSWQHRRMTSAGAEHLLLRPLCHTATLLHLRPLTPHLLRHLPASNTHRSRHWAPPSAAPLSRLSRRPSIWWWVVGECMCCCEHMRT